MGDGKGGGNVGREDVLSSHYCLSHVPRALFVAEGARGSLCGGNPGWW